jgi:hypothetical protein
MMLDDAQKILAETRQQNRQHSRMIQGNPALPLEDDVGIHIGDNNHPTSQAGGLGKMATAALVAAALFGGAGGAIGLMSLVKPAVGHIGPREFDVEWRVIDGKAQHKVVPVK